MATYRSKVREPFEQFWFALPNRSSRRPRRRGRRRLAGLERLLFHPDVDFGIAIGGVEADMAEPTPDDVDVDPRFQEMHRGSVAEDVG